MPRKARVALAAMVFHVLNRGVERRQLFETQADYDAIERIITETLNKCPMRICGCCLMPNHWHFVMSPEGDEDLGLFMQWLSVTHVKRWQKHRNVVGEGHLYQARFKSFPIGRLNGPVLLFPSLVEVPLTMLSFLFRNDRPVQFCLKS